MKHGLKHGNKFELPNDTLGRLAVLRIFSASLYLMD